MAGTAAGKGKKGRKIGRNIKKRCHQTYKANRTNEFNRERGIMNLDRHLDKALARKAILKADGSHKDSWGKISDMKRIKAQRLLIAFNDEASTRKMEAKAKAKRLAKESA